MRKFILALFLTGLSIGQSTFAGEGFELANHYPLFQNDVERVIYKLPEQESIFFNHNGIVFPGETIKMYLSRIQNEGDRIEILHALEKNTVRYGMLYLGNPDKTMTLMDAGCGSGGSGILIHDTFGCNVDGFTLSSDQAVFGNLIAQQYGFQDKVKIYQGDILNLNKEDQSYDCIWACESTEQIQDLSGVFTEFARVAKPNARLVIIAWCASDTGVKEQVDEYYDSNIHTFQDYLTFAVEAGWTPYHQNDLTGQTAMYWNIRASSHVATDAEKFIAPKFSSHELLYYIFTYERNE